MKIGAIVCALLAGVVLIFWLASGAQFVTKYQVPHEVTTTDEFGDEVTSTEMQDQFVFGLMPAEHIDGALPIGGFFAAGAVGLGLLHMRKKKNG